MYNNLEYMSIIMNDRYISMVLDHQFWMWKLVRELGYNN